MLQTYCILKWEGVKLFSEFSVFSFTYAATLVTSVKVNYGDEISASFKVCAYCQISFPSKNNNRGETHAIINHF